MLAEHGTTILWLLEKVFFGHTSETASTYNAVLPFRTLLMCQRGKEFYAETHQQTIRTK